MKLSVAIITKNEESNIRRCMESVAWADEIVILDSGSSDRTLEICREYTDRVYVDSDWQGFGVQKNRVLSLCRGEWILSLDADETVSDRLADEIRAGIAGAFEHDVYQILRLSTYCGRPIRHSGWWPDRVPRLFRNGSARFSDDLVHERLLHAGSAAGLSGILQHASYANLEQVLEKMNRYSTAGAEKMYQAGRRSSGIRAVLSGVWAFIRTWILRLGFLDGREGFMLAVSNAEGVYYKHMKLIQLHAKGRRES